MAKKPVPVTLDELEERAKQEEDGSCNHKIGKKWLEVIWVDSTVIKHFEYKFGKDFISREVADGLLRFNY